MIVHKKPSRQLLEALSDLNPVHLSQVLFGFAYTLRNESTPYQDASASLRTPFFGPLPDSKHAHTTVLIVMVATLTISTLSSEVCQEQLHKQACRAAADEQAASITSRDVLR